MMDYREEIFYRWLGGHLTDQEYFQAVKTLPKPWLTQKWEKIREIVLQPECENCGDTTALTLSHDWHPDNFADTYARIEAEADPQYQDKFDAYLRQFWSPEGFRRPGLKTFRKEPTETDLYVLGLEFRRLRYFGLGLNSETTRAAIIEQFLQSQRYWSMADTRTLCRRCAFVVDKRKRKII